MARRRPVPLRRRIFVGVEGASERSFMTWLQRLCDREELHLHLDVRVCGGGDSLAVVQFARREYERRSRDYAAYENGFVVLDADRLEQDFASGRGPPELSELKQIYLQPNLEGLLLRLHSGRENRRPTAQQAVAELGRLWPDYRKPASASMLERRFALADLQRAARHDSGLRLLLEELGLLGR